MSAELLVVGGTRTQESFPVTDRETIGRDPNCTIAIEDPDVAGVHAFIARTSDGGYQLTVAQGAKDVVVNGIAGRKTKLYHGQRILLGGTVLQFSCVAERNPSETSADFETPLPLRNVNQIERVWHSRRYGSSSTSIDMLKETEPHDRTLRCLYLVGYAVSAERTLARVLERTADAVMAAAWPDRLVIALLEPPNERLVSAVVRRGTTDPKGARIPVNRDVVQKSATQGISIITRCIHEGDAAARPVLCVPLSTRTKPVGALYLERIPDAAEFEENDLDFLGAVGRLVGMAVERVHLEADARSRANERDRERGRWLAVAQGLSSGVLIVDGNGRVEASNPAARRILKERLGVQDPVGVTRLGGIRLKTLLTEAPSPEPVVISGAQGAFLELRSSPVVGSEGERSGAALILTDATEERLAQAKRAQAEKLSMLGEMLAGVAHELNNPLATVLGYAEVLRRGAGTEDTQPLDVILEEAERCRRIVSSLLGFARTREADAGLVDAGSVAASVLDLLAHELKAAQLTVSKTLPPLPLVRADRYQLHQVFFNLAKNAIEAVKATGKPGVIVLMGDLRGERVRVEVRDSGPGFPKESHGALVPRPFHTTKGEGTGLGLSIAHGIVAALGGTMALGAAPEGGALVAVELPVGDREALPPTSIGGRTIGEHETSRAQESFGGRRILVVDDEQHVCELLAQILTELGHQPIIARNGSEALDRVRDEISPIAAVLSDIRMPGMGGDELFRKLRAQGSPLAEKLIFLTGDLAREETAAFVKASGRPALSKPFRLAQICRALEDVFAS